MYAVTVERRVTRVTVLQLVARTGCGPHPVVLHWRSWAVVLS